MLIYSMGVSADGFIADRDGIFAWNPPSDDEFRFQFEQIGMLGGYLLGRRLYELMLVWETDPTMRDLFLGAEFADMWTALPKVVFSRTDVPVFGNARLSSASLTDEITAALAGTDRDVSIGGADLAAQAIDLDLVDEFRMMRHPIIVGGGTRFIPPVTDSLQLELIDTRAFESHVVYERYRRIR